MHPNESNECAEVWPIILFMTDARIVMTTLNDLDLAKQLAGRLVELRVAACVNLIERVHSIYRWEGKVERADEVLLIIKTTAERVPLLKDTIAQLHPYQTPELIVVEVVDGGDKYLAWLLAESRDEPK